MHPLTHFIPCSFFNITLWAHCNYSLARQ